METYPLHVPVQKGLATIQYLLRAATQRALQKWMQKRKTKYPTGLWRLKNWWRF